MSDSAGRSESDAAILVRVLCDDHGQFPEEVARYILDRRFNDQEKVRMHDLAERNQEGTLSPVERKELFAFCKAGDILAILKSKARRTLGIKLRQT